MRKNVVKNEGERGREKESARERGRATETIDVLRAAAFTQIQYYANDRVDRARLRVRNPVSAANRCPGDDNPENIADGDRVCKYNGSSSPAKKPPFDEKRARRYRELGRSR